MEKRIIKTEEQAQQLEKEIGKNISFDTETTSLIYTDLELEGISLCDGRIACYIPYPNSSVLKILQNIFNKPDATLIAHNIVFDMKVLHKYGFNFKGKRLYDTMIADHLLDERREHGLKFLAKHYLNVEETITWEDARKKGGKVFEDYAINDAIWTYQICIKQQPMLKEEGLVRLFREIEMPFQEVLLEMAIEGIDVDLNEMNKIKKELIKKTEELEVQLHETLNIPYQMQMTLDGLASIKSSMNFNSAQQLADILFNKLKLPIIEKTPSGAPSVGKLTISALKDKHPFVTLLSQYKIVQKLLSAFFEPIPQLVEKDGKIRPNFRDIGTKTGRLSCNSPNLQQLPKVNKQFPIDTRKCFVVPSKYQMITCDYAGQELRVLTQITQEPVLIDTFNKGKDMHLSTANDFFDLGIAEEDLYEGSPNIETLKDKFKDERNKAKVVNFGMAYGKGAFGFSKDFNISEDEAQKILDKYFAALPKVKEAIDKCHQEVTDKGEVVSMTGRKRRFEKVEKNGWVGYLKGSYRQSFNFLIQGFSADMIRLAAIKVYKEAQKHPEWDLKSIMTVHDEVVYKVKEEYTEEASKLIKHCFETAVKFCIPIVADIGVGNNYGEAK